MRLVSAFFRRGDVVLIDDTGDEWSAGAVAGGFVLIENRATGQTTFVDATEVKSLLSATANAG